MRLICKWCQPSLFLKQPKWHCNAPQEQLSLTNGIVWRQNCYKTGQQCQSATQCRYKPSNNSNGQKQVKFLQSI